jgi:hypothetical protein
VLPAQGAGTAPPPIIPRVAWASTLTPSIPEALRYLIFMMVVVL